MENLIGKSNGLQLDLLWENANPTSAFEPQTINLDLTNYKMIGIDFRIINTQTSHLFGLFIKSNNETHFGGLKRYELYNDTLYRGISYIKNNAIRFLQGTRDTTDGAIANDVMIPIAIYGIK